MARDVRDYVRSFDSRQRVKPSTQVPVGLLQPLPIPDQKWESVSLDFIVNLPKTPSGFDAILVVIDRLNKMAHFIPTHKTDGQTERTNRTLISVIRAFINPHHTNWDSLLPSLEFAYNNSSQSSTHETPFFLSYGHHPISPSTFTSLATTNPTLVDFLQTLSSPLQTAK